MILLLLALLDWFSVYQYAPRNLVLRGCSECKGETDDVCEVRAGAQVRRLDEIRGAADGRVYLLRSRADPDCAVPMKALLQSPLELAAMRVARAAPSQALLDRAKPAVKGWPRAPQKRKGEPASPAAKPQRSALRLSLVCWASEQGWPRAGLDASNPCEWWLLPLKDGEPDLSAASFPLESKPFSFGDSRWSRAFDPAAALDDSVLLGEAAPPPPEPAAPAAVPLCGDAARARTAVLDRFEQWEAMIRGARASIDPATWTLNAAAWSGHCQEMDVLRGALEQQLGCVLTQQGHCARSP
jgi:hypothetical protein